MVFSSQGPASVVDAHRLLDGVWVDHWEVPEASEVDPKITAFLDSVFVDYPPLEALDHNDPADRARSIWSVTPRPETTTSVYLCMGWSSPPEVADKILDLVARHRLVLYDPQDSRLYNPPMPEAVGPRLTMENGSVIDSPSPGQLLENIGTLDRHNTYAAYQTSGDRYIQVRPRSGPTTAPMAFALEYRADERHLLTYVDDLDAIKEAFVGVATGDARWMEMHSWDRLVELE